MLHKYQFNWPRFLVNAMLFGLPVCAAAYLIRFKPEYYIHNGGYLFAIASIIGSVFMLISEDKRSWRRNYVIGCCVALLISLILISLLVSYAIHKTIAIVLLFAFVPVSETLFIAEVTDAYKFALKSGFKTKRRFYEWFWLFSAGFGVLCDTIERLNH